MPSGNLIEKRDQMALEFVVVETVMGRPKADILQSLLEAHSIPTQLSQESAGATTGITVGPMGEVQILVPRNKAEEAKSLLEDFYTGKLE
jgi:hypothetical protein